MNKEDKNFINMIIEKRENWLRTCIACVTVDAELDATRKRLTELQDTHKKKLINKVAAREALDTAIKNRLNQQHAAFMRKAGIELAKSTQRDDIYSDHA